MHGESSSKNYQKKFQRSKTSLVRTGKTQTFKLVFLENVILLVLLFKNSRPSGGGGTTRPLPRDGGMEELRGDPTVGPHIKVWTID